MIDVAQFSSWLVVALFFIGVGFILRFSGERGLSDRWEQLSVWLAAHAATRDPDDEDEDFARVELREVIREERLRADLDRLRHLLATDTYMSATRQLGNRIAYQQLLAESRTFATRPVLVPPSRSWALESVDLATTRRSSGPESLDIRWR